VRTRIWRLAADGVGLRGIARTPNSEGVMRKHGKSWHSSTVKYLLENEQLYGRRAA